MHSIILGAGASVCAKAPTVAEFRQSAELVAARMHHNFGHASDEVFRSTVRYWVEKFPHYNVEEFYVMAELQQLLGISNPVQNPLNHGLADCVQSMIAKTLAAVMTNGRHPAHEALANYAVQNKAALMTLNWDLTMDNAIAEVSSQLPGTGYPMTVDATSQTAIGSQHELLKMHGSLNWWFCQDGHLSVVPGRKVVAGAWDGGTNVCEIGQCVGRRRPLRPLMVPPSSQKLSASSAGSPLRAIWQRASERLRSSTKISIVGYSFPATDIQFRMLVQEAVVNAPELKRLEFVSSRKFGSDRARFEDHHSGLLSSVPRSVDCQFIYSGFEGWAGHLLLRTNS